MVLISASVGKATFSINFSWKFQIFLFCSTYCCWKIKPNDCQIFLQLTRMLTMYDPDSFLTGSDAQSSFITRHAIWFWNQLYLTVWYHLRFLNQEQCEKNVLFIITWNLDDINNCFNSWPWKETLKVEASRIISSVINDKTPRVQTLWLKYFCNAMQKN